MRSSNLTLLIPCWFRKNDSDQVAVIGVTWSKGDIDTPGKYMVWQLPEKLRNYGGWTPYVIVNKYEIVGVRM